MHGYTQVVIDNAGSVNVFIVENIPQEMIADALLSGKARLDLPNNKLHWFDKIWSLHLDTSHGIAGLSQTFPSTHIQAIDDVLKHFADVFSGPNEPNGFCQAAPLQIVTQGEPIYQRPYRAPLTKRQEISKAVDDMLAEGIIRPSSSPWASPITLVPKKDGSTRFCVDFRKLNQVTKRDRYPLPRIDSILDQMGGSTVFTTLDLKSGYHQLPVHPNDIEKTAFTCHRGQFEFLRVPFGLCNAPSHFQRVMETILHDLLGVCVLVYIDDLVIYSTDMESHIGHVQLVLQRIRKANLHLKPSKCHFGQKEVKLLGYVVNKSGIQPDPDKTAAIQALSRPTTVKQVRSFLGMANYYRNCIPNYANIAAPLTELTRKNQRFHWTHHHDKSFQTLKKALTSSAVVSFPRTELPYRLYTDASDHTVGAILVQCHEDGIEHVVQYVSHQLSDTQKRWATIEKEAYAVVYAITKLRPYLYGSKFTVYTDHKPLTSLFTKPMINTKIQRWAILLSEYGADIKYFQGRYNVRADMLSRIPTEHVSVIDVDHEWIDPAAFPDDVAFQQLPCLLDDLDLQVISAEQRKEFPDLFKSAKFDDDSLYVVFNNVLYSTRRPSAESASYPRLVLPHRYRENVT